MHKHSLKFWFFKTLLCWVFLGIVLPFFPLNAAEEARLMERWVVNDVLSTRVVDHSPWQTILDTYRVETPDGVLFDYAAVTEEDIQKLDSYLLTLSRTDVDRLNQKEQMAFWINAFNALAVRIVLSEFPVSSINDIGGGIFSSGPWAEKRFRVYLIDLSLNDIYHRILRPIWMDNRLHYALSCAAKGCPDLPKDVFTGANLEDNLKDVSENFINGSKAILQVSGNAVRLSRIYDWYKEDFGGEGISVINHLRRLGGVKAIDRLRGVDTVSGHAFNWSLNNGKRRQ